MWQYFLDADPYQGFDPSPYPEDLEGWGSDDPIFDTVIAHARPRLIVEVGSWKGRSAINMGRICRRLGIDAKIVCVDTWLGMIEAYTERDVRPSFHAGLRMKNGWPQIYYQFLANVVRAGLHDVIVPFPQTSELGARVLRHFKLEPDVVYIDASHDYWDVARDLVNYCGLVRSGGIVFGDDFLAYEGVTRAVREFSERMQQPHWARYGKFLLVKDGHPGSVPGLA